MVQLPRHVSENVVSNVDNKKNWSHVSDDFQKDEIVIQNLHKFVENANKKAKIE